MQRVSFDRVDFFLGATTPAGFKGYFEPLRREPGMQMVLIKSGPGCGKSTLMKQLARRAIQQGEPVECIHCASDPDSFDGVIFVRQRRAIVDATAPHTIEPDAPGADEVVLSLYHTIQADALRPHAEEVKALFARNAALRARAARYVASAGSLLLDSRRAEACSANFEKVRRYVKRLCTRLLPRTENTAREELRLLSAVTPKGEVFYQHTAQALADRFIVFRDEYGAVSRLLLELIRAEALARGLASILTDSDRILIARSRGGSPVLTSILEKAGLVYDDIVLYQVEGRQVSEQRQAEEGFDYITFASASGVRAYLSSGLNINPGQRTGQTRLVCIGDITAGELKKHGIKADITAGTYHIQGLVQAIADDAISREAEGSASV